MPRISSSLTLSNISFATSGGNVSNCGGPAQPATPLSIGTTTIVCAPNRSSTGAITTTPNTVTEQLGCGNGHGAVVAVTCNGTGVPASGALNITVQVSVSEQCNDTIDTSNVQTNTFSGIVAGELPTLPVTVESCDVFSNICATGNFCPFNMFQTDITVSNVGGL